MPSGPERVQEAADVLGLEVTVLRLPDSTRTAPEAARAVGCEVGAIAKSLLFVADGEPVLVICAGDRRVDTARLAEVLGAEQVAMAPALEVRRVTGYAIGGVPPVGHAMRVRALFDSALLRWPLIYAAAGAHDALFSVDPRRLLEVSAAELADVGEAIG
ncbi:MAG: YbaK/EbsC family protein [Chloroflexota bacterium]|nr:YbaK/EbsC family protein [Chloroflexota bacterium]